MKKVKMMVLAILGAAIMAGSVADAGFARAWADRNPAAPVVPNASATAR
jgi:hypothetical protein